MKRNAVLIAVLIALMLKATAPLFAELQLSIRYHDKKIYYPGDKVQLKMTLSNPVGAPEEEISVQISDDPVESFGFELRSLAGQPMEAAAGFASALNIKDAYRILSLSPGQELSVTVELNDWVDLSQPGQYRLTGFVFPERRAMNAPALMAVSALDLSIMPETNPRWQEELSAEVRGVLIARNLDPVSVVMETLTARRDMQLNRAALYLDTSALSVGNMLIESAWEQLPGLEFPAADISLVSSQIYPREAAVRVRASYNPFGEAFIRELQFFLHDNMGYWAIRRIEAVSDGDADPMRYGVADLDPPQVVSTMLQAATRGDWDLVLRYYDVSETVRTLPEYSGRWNTMSATEHRAALDVYRQDLAAGRLPPEEAPFTDLENWAVSRVNYSDTEGSIVVENTKMHSTAAGPMEQKTLYTFRLVQKGTSGGGWQVIRYSVAVIRN